MFGSDYFFKMPPAQAFTPPHGQHNQDSVEEQLVEQQLYQPTLIIFADDVLILSQDENVPDVIGSEILVEVATFNFPNPGRSPYLPPTPAESWEQYDEIIKCFIQGRPHLNLVHGAV